MRNKPNKKFGKNSYFQKGLIVSSILFLTLWSFPKTVEAGGVFLYLSPSKGTFFIGSTFSVSVYVDTKGNEINVVEIDLKFPSEILQITSPTTGESFVSEWLTPPSYSNLGGTISFKGGIPGGITTSAGVVSTITFRAKSSGTAKIEFSSSSKVLLNDGKGTPILADAQIGVYEILVPPPEGPKIFSPTHPDSDIWYSNSSPTFSWETEGATDFSFSFSQNPQENPDTVSEENVSLKSYDQVPDGIWYFHLRSKKNGIWGKTNYFAVRIDTSPPQKFEPRVDTRNGFIYFETKDFHSGIDHYEISILNFTDSPAPAPFFIEATSPFRSPSIKAGKYSVIIRAIDRAGNWQEAETKFQIILPLISLIEGKGVEFKGIFLPWNIIYLILFFLIVTITFLIFYFTRRRKGFKKGIREIREAIEEIEKIESKENGIEKLKKQFEEEKGKLEKRLGKGESGTQGS